MQLDPVVAHPMPVRALARYFPFDFAVRHDAFLAQIDQKHLSGGQLSLTAHVLRSDFYHAGFRSHDHIAVFGHGVPARTQTVPVQQTADIAPAVGVKHRRGTVPRFHQSRVVFVKSALVLAHNEFVAERFGHHHHHGMRQRPSRQSQHFQNIIENHRITARFIDHGFDFFDVRAVSRTG